MVPRRNFFSRYAYEQRRRCGGTEFTTETVHGVCYGGEVAGGQGGMAPNFQKKINKFLIHNRFLIILTLCSPLPPSILNPWRTLCKTPTVKKNYLNFVQIFIKYCGRVHVCTRHGILQSLYESSYTLARRCRRVVYYYF